VSSARFPAPTKFELGTLRRRAVSDVRDPFLSQRLGGGGWLSGKLKHCCCLTFGQVRQKLNLPVGKFQRVVVCARLAFVNLPKDSRGVLDCFHFTAKQANPRTIRSSKIPRNRLPPTIPSASRCRRRRWPASRTSASFPACRSRPSFRPTSAPRCSTYSSRCTTRSRAPSASVDHRGPLGLVKRVAVNYPPFGGSN
jgi:hypothetical protein